MGDTGIPKKLGRKPAGGYLTEIVTFPPDPKTGRRSFVPQSSAKMASFSAPARRAFADRGAAELDVIQSPLRSLSEGSAHPRRENLLAMPSERNALDRFRVQCESQTCERPVQAGTSLARHAGS